jgi:iron complex outermembrane recepter protein
MKLKHIVQGLLVAGLASSMLAHAQQRIEITGSSIKRIADEGALPLQIIRRVDLERQGISSAEQLILQLSVNGNSQDNLASNSDVVDGPNRGVNGVSAANLRGQGSNATLVLLNGRRISAHGLNGGVVDLNQIPFSALDRVEILKDGASAIYGTDAVGGVINFITRSNFSGLIAEVFTDVTEQGGGNIHRGSLTAGFGDMEKNKFNVLAVLAFQRNEILRGTDRDFTSGFRSSQGLSPDTRGAPHGTIVPLAGTIIPAAGSAPFIPGSTTQRASGGINVLNLPGGPGCGAIAGMAPYDYLLWDAPANRFACAYDTMRAAVLQQPVDNTSLLTRGSLALGAHRINAEFVAAKVESAKSFSEIQLLPSTGLNPLRFPRNADSAAVYDEVARRLTAVFPTLGPLMDPNRVGGPLPISYRWRCMECGPREIRTVADTDRFFLGFEGPLFGNWEYRAGASKASSEARSVLGTGYYYRRNGVFSGKQYYGIVEALNTGKLNPFLLPGQTQSAAGLAELARASAEGTALYSGRYTTTQVDAVTSGPLFKIDGREAMAALGVDFRKEKYRFDGDERPVSERPEVLGAPFDQTNVLSGVSRDVKSVYAELYLPLLKSLDLTLAARRDDYTGFGSTNNPKVTVRFQPLPQLLFRGSYNTAFRVPSFNQIYNQPSDADYLGADLADPSRCPNGTPNSQVPGCEVLTGITIRQGGKIDLGPETADQYSIGLVVEPSPGFSVSVDFWSIERENQIRFFSAKQLAENYNLFADRFIRDGTGRVVLVDARLANSGGTKTAGVEVGLRANGQAMGGRWTASADISYLVERKSRLTLNAAYGASEVGRNVLGGEIGLRWKHNAAVSFTKNEWSTTLSQVYRSGYADRLLPGVSSGRVVPPNFQARVASWATYNLVTTYSGIKNLKITGGIKNLMNSNPPFANTYDDGLGAGFAWDPRVADPRGRSFTLKLEYQFF